MRYRIVSGQLLAMQPAEERIEHAVVMIYGGLTRWLSCADSLTVPTIGLTNEIPQELADMRGCNLLWLIRIFVLATEPKEACQASAAGLHGDGDLFSAQ